jgi:hypothetical protein
MPNIKNLMIQRFYRIEKKLTAISISCLPSTAGIFPKRKTHDGGKSSRKAFVS